MSHLNRLKLLVVFAVLCQLHAVQGVDDEQDNSLYEDLDRSIDLSLYGEALFGNPDNVTTGTLVTAYKNNSAQNPEELGTYFEGDILIPEERRIEFRNGILKRTSRWPGAVVPYEIKGQFTTQQLRIIQHAFNEYHKRTCIRFRPRTTERDYISIGNSKSGCWSSIGRMGGKQEVNLQTPGCMYSYGTTIHELMHALGFFHEQNRHERDSYIRVLTENIQPASMFNFKKSSPRTVYAFGVNYDYASVMHYSPSSFSKNGLPTIMALLSTPEARLMGQRQGFSQGDVDKINAMYQCK